MKKIIKKLLPKKLSIGLVNFKNHSLDGYSQEGEDMIFRRLFEHQEKDFYVDVGAHHPFRFSNTYFFKLAAR